VDDLLCIGIVDRAEIQRVGVLAVIDMWTIVHERLLQTGIAPKTFVVPNGPSFTDISMVITSLDQPTHDHNRPCAYLQEECQ
jgi:hypothetical protein